MTEPLTVDERAELEALRARVTTLEAERSELLRSTATTVAAAQKRAYWLDRWHVDLNAVMARPGASETRALLRAARSVVRRLRTFARRVRS